VLLSYHPRMYQHHHPEIIDAKRLEGKPCSGSRVANDKHCRPILTCPAQTAQTSPDRLWYINQLSIKTRNLGVGLVELEFELKALCLQSSFCTA
jgi:hypothetical protein